MVTRIMGVQCGEIPYYWDEAIKLLEPAIVRARGTITRQTVYDELVDRDAQLWLAIDEAGAIEAAATTKIICYPEIKVMAMPIIGGKNRGNWLPFEPMFIDFAKSHGCEAIEGYMRPGWIGLVRKMAHSVLGKEWVPCWTVVRKKI